MYLLTESTKIQFTSLPNGQGEWLHTRDPLNDRGDESTVQERKVSVETKGIYSGIRGGAWVRRQSNTFVISPTTPMYFLHWASLMEGCEAAHEDPKNADNSKVRTSVANGIKDCKVYRFDMPDFVVDYLVSLGNDTNTEASGMTFMQVYRSSERAAASWKRACDASDGKWTVKSLGQGVYEAKKLDHVNAMFKDGGSGEKKKQVAVYQRV